MTIVSQRRALQQVIERMPDNLITEIVTFVKYLQFKEQEGDSLQDEQNIFVDTNLKELFGSEATPPFRPVDFPEGIITGFDFSPEYIAEARKEIWAGTGDSLNDSVRE